MYFLSMFSNSLKSYDNLPTLIILSLTTVFEVKDVTDDICDFWASNSFKKLCFSLSVCAFESKQADSREGHANISLKLLYAKSCQLCHIFNFKDCSWVEVIYLKERCVYLLSLAGLCACVLQLLCCCCFLMVSTSLSLAGNSGHLQVRQSCHSSNATHSY